MGARTEPAFSACNCFELNGGVPNACGITDANLPAGGQAMDFDGNQQQNNYAVEVSGWDMSETFFVEKTSLTWAADGNKEISLRRPVREGCVVFVRLMQPVASADNYPIACQAVKVMEQAADGHSAVQLTQLRPRAFFKDAARDMNYSATKVA
jgi:hypothetical protein